MSRIPKGFISIGGDALLNINVIDQEASYFDKRINKVAVIDIYGIRYNVDPILIKGKITWRE